MQVIACLDFGLHCLAMRLDDQNPMIELVNLEGDLVLRLQGLTASRAEFSRSRIPPIRIEACAGTFCVNVATRVLTDRFHVNIKPPAWWSLLWCV